MLKYNVGCFSFCFFFFKQKTAYEIVPCDWSSDVCSSDLPPVTLQVGIVTGGDGTVFSAGWDLKAAANEGISERTDYGVGGFAGLTQLFDLTKPVVAAVNGTAVGAGMELALACDIIVAADSAEMFLPETSLGIMADAGGVQRLPRKLPHNI